MKLFRASIWQWQIFLIPTIHKKQLILSSPPSIFFNEEISLILKLLQTECVCCHHDTISIFYGNNWCSSHNWISFIKGKNKKQENRKHKVRGSNKRNAHTKKKKKKKGVISSSKKKGGKEKKRKERKEFLTKMTLVFEKKWIWEGKDRQEWKVSQCIANWGTNRQRKWREFGTRRHIESQNYRTFKYNNMASRAIAFS